MVGRRAILEITRDATMGRKLVTSLRLEALNDNKEEVIILKGKEKSGEKKREREREELNQIKKIYDIK